MLPSRALSAVSVLTIAFAASTLVHCGGDADDARPPGDDDTGIADSAVSESGSDSAIDSTLDAAEVASDSAADSGTPLIVINEVESNGGTPGDWVEFFNAGTAAIDLSGYKFKDSDDTHGSYVLPTGSIVAPGAFLVIDEADLGYGLGAADSARLFAPDGTTIVATYAWTTHATTTYGRCPNGTGALQPTTTATKGAANDCPTGSDAGTDALLAWPGANMATIVDGMSVFGPNLSGLFYDGSGTKPYIWAVRNSPSTLFRLTLSGTTWTTDSGTGWAAGKTLRYVDGTGKPDAEDVTRGDLSSSFLYVATERDGDVSATSRPAILSYDMSSTKTTLDATREWNLTSDLPVVLPNSGLEGITFLPDTYLVANGFRDERLSKTYSPADYANHGGGLFMVGLESNGALYVYALDHIGGGSRRVATIDSGLKTIVAVSLDREVGGLYAYCDVACGNRLHVLAIDTTPGSMTLGRFVVKAQYARPSSLPDVGNEGITFAPESTCSGGQKAFFWADDTETAGHVLRRDTIPCGRFY